MNSLSPWTAKVGRSGFTILEMVVALGIGAIVMTLVATAYVGANKAQSVTVGTGMLKDAGLQGINDLHQTIRQSGLIMGRGGYAIGMVSRLPLKTISNPTGLEPELIATEVVFPEVLATGEFSVEDSQNVQNQNFKLSAVGNALMFASVEPKAIVAEETTPAEATVLQDVTGVDEAHIAAYRIHLYFLARRKLPIGGHRIRPDAHYTYQLMHWNSEPYLDYSELTTWMKRIVEADVTDDIAVSAPTYIATKLTKLRTQYAGALKFRANPSRTDANSEFLYDLTLGDGTGQVLTRNAGGRLKSNDQLGYRAALRFAMKDKVGESFVAFNTLGVGTTIKGVRVPGLTVPVFAESGTGIPFGFEVMVGGEPPHRQVLLRLALAARTQPGNVLMGQAFQETIHVFADTASQ